MQVESEIRLLYDGSIQMMEGHCSLAATFPKHEGILRPFRRVVQFLLSEDRYPRGTTIFYTDLLLRRVA